MMYEGSKSGGSISKYVHFTSVRMIHSSTYTQVLPSNYRDNLRQLIIDSGVSQKSDVPLATLEQWMNVIKLM
jgi:hypothetical protein